MNQQGFERQLPDIALIGQRQQHEFPLTFSDGRTQVLQHRANPLQLGRVAINEVFQHVEAVSVGQHQAVRRLPVAPRPADLLAVIFDRLGQIKMHHIADVAFVDAHAEGNGGDDAVQLPAHELTLDAFALIVGQTGVIGAGADPVLIQVLGDVLGRLLQGDVDNTRLALTLTHPLHQPLTLGSAGNRFDPQIEIGAIKTGGDDIGFSNRELGLHVHNDRGRGGGREQQHLWDIELTLVVRKLQIVRTEVMAPLRNTVRLVHHQQRNRDLLQKMSEALVFQALDRNHQNFQLP